MIMQSPSVFYQCVLVERTRVQRPRSSSHPRDHIITTRAADHLASKLHHGTEPRNHGKYTFTHRTFTITWLAAHLNYNSDVWTYHPQDQWTLHLAGGRSRAVRQLASELAPSRSTLDTLQRHLSVQLTFSFPRPLEGHRARKTDR